MFIDVSGHGRRMGAHSYRSHFKAPVRKKKKETERTEKQGNLEGQERMNQEKKRKAEHTGHISQGRWKTIRLGIEHDVAMGSLPAGQPRRQWRTQDAPGGGNQLSIAWFSPQRRDGRRMAVLMESDVLLMRIKMNARRDRQLQDERGGDDKREERERKREGERGGERREKRRPARRRVTKEKKKKSNQIE